MSRACVQCTLLCADPAASCCSLCGGALTKTFNRSLNSGTCIDLDDDSQQEVGADCARQKSRACPRCTLICESDLCDACGAEMEPVRKRPKTETTGHGAAPALSRPPGIADFFSRRAEPSPTPTSIGAALATASAVAVSEDPPLPPPAEPPPEALGEEPSGSWCAAEAASELVKSCESFGHARVTKGLSPLKGLPYRLLAAALDALEATKSRLSKDAILTNAFRTMLAMSVSVEEA
ncbi:unnamed protein product [Durusdinium trenchii]|uniref:Uncharacterized protein n=1 Tax=Durusdinium trenchii TaxID=1381693 RepID=A0ABP0QAA3_9DINO